MSIAINWPAAFSAFCTGATVSEITSAFGMSRELLMDRIEREGWHPLREKVQKDSLVLWEENGRELAKAKPDSTLTAEIEAKLELIRKNREINYKDACALREKLQRVLIQLLDGTYEVEKVFHNKGQIVVHRAKPGPGDLLNLGSFARTVADLTYRALGDAMPIDKQQSNPSTAAGTPAPSVTIILPAAVSQPRQAQVIDLTPPKPGSTPPEKPN